MSMKIVLNKLTSMVLVICMLLSLAAPAVGEAPLSQTPEEPVYPDGTTVYADGTLIYADGTIVYADGTTVYADGVTVDAEGTTVYPDGTAVYLDGRIVYADGTTAYPDGTTVYADGTVIYANGTIVYADGTTVYADGATVNADGTTVYPDGTTVYVDGTVVYADGTTGYPDGTVVYPDGTTVKADGTTLYVDGTIVYPDGITAYPDGKTVYPDGTTVDADGTTVYPDGTIVYADRTTLYPDGTTVYPDGTAVYADGTTLYPDGTTVYADGSTLHPDGTMTYPESNTEPVVEEEPAPAAEPEQVIPENGDEAGDELPADSVIPADPAEETQPETDPDPDDGEEKTETTIAGKEAEKAEEAGNTEEQDGEEARDPEEDQEKKTEETTEETASPAEELPLRTLTVSAGQMAFRDQYLNSTEPVLWSGSVWNWLYGSAIEPAYTDGHVTVEISGHIPETVTARAMFVEFADPGAARNAERALMLLDVALLDETGAFYVPTEKLHVSVSSGPVYGAVESGEPFVAYFDDSYDGVGEAGDIKVRLDESVDGSRLVYVPEQDEALRFWEAGGRLSTTGNGSVDFDENRIPFRFVLSAQQAEVDPEELAGQEALAKDIMLSGTLVASDGYTYEVSVSYPANCGIPVGAELSVEELLLGTDAYWAYINQSAAELGVSPADLSLARAFDISLVDPATGVHYQPTQDVQVSILLISTPLNTEEEISVLHFDDEAGEVQAMDVALNGETIEFETNGFSVFVVLQRVIEKNLTAGDGNTYHITVDYDSTSGIPDGVELEVAEIREGDAGYDDYVARSAAELGENVENLGFARAFDISLVDPATGTNYQPNKNVKVSIQVLNENLSDYESVDVVHFGNDVEVMNASVNGEAVEFATDGFSVYVVCAYTVDFHWGDYTYSIAGENEILLSQLLEKLGVTEITLSDVVSVSFSNPNYISIEQTGSDWLLRSLAPFSTEEVLVLTLTNGKSVEIKVTDAVTLPVNGTWNNGSNGSGTWNIDENGVLTVTGSGAMKDYNNNPWVGGTPWFEYIVKDSTHPSPPVTKVVIEDGITRIGTNSFTRTYNLNEIDVSNCSTLTAIGGSAFKQQNSSSASSNTENPKIINFSGCENLTTIETDAFRDCNGIEELDISGTKLTANHITTSGAGFGSGKNSLKTLRANGCTTGFTTLDLTGWNSLQTLELSGCTSLTTLDVSNCTSLTSLDVSNCTSLTSLTVPSSVTSLNVSGSALTSLDLSACTNLTALNISDCTRLTSLDVSDCTGLTALDLSSTSLTNIDVSNNASLTALKLPATVSALNINGCENLVLYFDGTSAELNLNLPEGIPTICWGDYTYTIARGATVTLDYTFNTCGITAINSTDVEGIAVSDESSLQVSDLTVTNLKSFTEPQTLTLTLKNSMTGRISIVCSALEESDNLNLFLDANTVYSYEGKTDTYSLSEPAILSQGDTLNLTLSFSEIPEGQVDERQMALLAPMTYTFPAGMTVTEYPNSVTFKLGDDTYTFPVTVTLNTDTETGVQNLVINVNYGDQEALVSASTEVRFNLPVTVQPGQVPGEYDLGNNITLSAVGPRNVKVSISSEDYDNASRTIQYTVTVEAENNLDDETTEYPVTITDLTTGDSPDLQFLSGSYTYTQGNVPEGAPVTEINEAVVTPGTPTEFTQFPLTVTHMYEGDTITLTYTAEVLRGYYNTGSGQTEVQNTVTITTDNPSNIPEDDTASTTENIPYTPLERKYVSLSGSWAYWQVTVNPNGYTLNGGEKLTLTDTFDDKVAKDAEQSIDYNSIKVIGSGVTYDYSGSTGTFIIPDNTPVTITYRTRITAQPGEEKTFRGTAVLKNTTGNTIASATAGAITKAAVIYPSAADVTGSDYMVRLYVYAKGQMQTGIEGVTFILLDANQRALEYNLGENKGQPVTFTTGSDGYVNIELQEEDGDITIEKNTGYYLEMMQAVEGYQKDNTLYGFMITDDPTYSSGGFYKYFNGDTMKVRLYPSSGGLNVSIRFSGSYALREDQKNNVTAVLQRLDDDTDSWVEVERHPYTDSQQGAIKFETVLYDAELTYHNSYRVIEENESPWDLPEGISLTTSYYCMVNADESVQYKEPQEFWVEKAEDSVNVVIDNRYEEAQLTIVKMDKQTGKVLPGAVFSVYKIEKGAASGNVVTTYTTDEAGELVIRGGESFESETLYGIKETTAPEDYLLPLKEEWHYFYFCNDEYLEPSIRANLPEDATAINLTTSGDRITIDNQKEIITIPVMKLWQGNTWPEETAVVVGLYQSVAGGKAETVLDGNSKPRTVTLTSASPYNNIAFTGLPSRDDQNRNIVYSIKEESINGITPLEAGYVQEYGISSSGVYIVRNKPATTLTVSKEWYQFNPVTGKDEKVEDESELAEQSSVTFDVYRSNAPFEDKTPDDGITNADMESFVGGLVKVRENQSFGAEDKWTLAINDLDEQDDLGNPYYYYVLETVPSFGTELYEVNEENYTVTIQNKIAPESVPLTVTKAALVRDPRPESLNRDFEFTLKLTTADGSHPIRSWQVYTDPADPNNNLITDWNGEAKFTLKPTDPDQQTTPEASIRLALPVDVTATVTETYNPEYTVETTSSAEGSKDDENRSFSYVTRNEDGDVTLTYTNTLHVICKVVDDLGVQTPFETLKRALAFIRENSSNFTSPWTIYMLEDYTIPATDGIVLEGGKSLTLTTASTTDEMFPFKGGEETDRAVITRGEVGDSMLKNAGTLTLENICLDGGNVTAAGNGGLVNSTGTLNLNDKTTLRNSAADGKGGAVYAEGTVNIVDGAEIKITGNSAPSASALYLKGTFNMPGGEISGNTGAADGAVVLENTGDMINLSGNPVIIGNTNAQGKAANLYIGADSDNIVNVVAPGLGEEAQIGITAMDGHMLIGEQFATAEYGQTANLKRFVNDVYGYHGKLKDGTSINVVWDGLTVKIKKSVDPVGANPNDRFTITLRSMSIIMSSYVVDGTLDYTVTAARQNRPGWITLRNVKADDEITISPLPVGEYVISETASNYEPTYTFVETGSKEEPESIEGGTFTAENDSSITVTNTRKLADMTLTKTLDDRLADAAVPFTFTVKLTDADGTAIKNFTLAEGITTNGSGEASFTMSPTDTADVIQNFQAPVGATMTITETVNPNYRISASAKTIKTMPPEGEDAAITDADTDNDNVFTFPVTEDGADVTFANVRKMAEIELSKTLVGKVSKTESFTFTVTLTNGSTPVADYMVYRDEANPENNITTNDRGVATITLTFVEDETDPKSIPLTIPEGTKLVVAETEVKKNVNGTEQAIYTTKYSVNDGSVKTGTIVTINSVSDTDQSIAFTNTRKTNTITVKNTVKGYSGNTDPFTYTATVTDGGEDQDDYDANGFEDGVMTFELTNGQTRTLTVPYGATLTVAEGFIVGYSTTVKRGSAGAVEALSDTFVVTANMSSSSPLLFTNNQLIGLQLVNNTSSALENVTVTVEKDKIYRVNENKTGQELIGDNKTATLSIAAGETAVLEIEHDTSKIDASQKYTVNGNTPALGFYYTIKNEPSFHEYADPAILRVYNANSFEVKGRLRYSVSDSTVTFTEQPLVSFDSNGGTWTSEMEGYKDRDGDRKVYQKAVTSGETVSEPDPKPVYPTAEGIPFLGWTTDEDFAKQPHTESEDVSEKAYDFDTPVTEPITLYAVWARDPNARTVTVKNGLNTELTVTVTLSNDDPSGANYTLYEDTGNPSYSIKTDENGVASFTLAAKETRNLHVPNGAKLVISGSSGVAYSTDYTDADSAPESFIIDAVDNDGTVSFIGGIFKITDADGKLLYDANGRPAVYGNLRKINNADPDEAFDAYDKTLYTDATHTTPAAPAAVKQLVDEYKIPNTAAIAFPNATMTLTTAGKDDADFPYAGVRDRATIYRSTAGANANCFTLSQANSNITLTNIILDGGSEQGVKIAKDKNGGLIFMNNASGVLNVTMGTTLRNCEFAAYDTANNSRGGAIYVTNGTLNVNAGLFSNLHARQGGAICVTGGALNVTGTEGSTRFENCYAEIDDGGAIYYANNNKALVINGGTDKNDPGILFVDCKAKSNAGDGGAIYVNTNYNNDVSVKGCEFYECSAKVNIGGDTAGNGGGGIAAYQVKSLEVSYCAFIACDTLRGGGAITTYINNNNSVSISECSFDSCNCMTQGGALAAYQKTNSNSTSTLNLLNCSFSNCSSGTQNSSGGAIQCYLPCMDFTGTSFTDCWAGKEGGAVNNFFGGDYLQLWNNSYLKLNNCAFTRCRAEDRYEVTSVIHYGGAINTKVKIVEVTDCEFEECVSTLRDGGALHLGGCGTGTTATIENSSFKNCSGKRHGGAVFSSAAMLTIKESTFNGCTSTADLGGAVYHGMNCRQESNVKVKTEITGCTFNGCWAANNGGAVWTAAQSAEIEDCTIENCISGNGGAVYFSEYDIKNTLNNSRVETNTTNISVPLPAGILTRGIITGGFITGCQAVQGSAVYVGHSAIFSGGLSVTGNTVSGANSGAIQTVDAGKLYFEGNVVVDSNTCSSDSAYNHDVLMQINGNTIINTTSVGLGSGAKIGVYVSDPNNAYANHGQYGQPFGTYHASTEGSNFLDAFFNNRNGELYGCQMSADDTKIYWGNYVCKITDADGNTLTRPNGRDAVYQRLSKALDEFTLVSGGNPVYIKMLIEDYTIRQTGQIENFPAADITLTTASASDAEHPYRGTEGTVCTIYRTNSENPLFSLSTADATFQLKDITLDGRKDRTATEGDYKLITATAGKIIVNSGTTLQYAKGDNGAAISGVAVTINGNYDTEKKEPTVKITNCTATGNRGAISAETLTITNAEPNAEGKYGTAFTDCTATGSGGAIFATGTEVSVKGASFTNCTATYEGGVLFHDNDSADASTTIQNCLFDNGYTTGGAGGAVSSKAGTLTVEKSAFSACSASSDGGAINHTGTTAATITGTTFTDCSATSSGFGGSVYTQAKTVEVIDSSFKDSTAGNHGGALYCASSVEDSESTVSGTSFVNCSTTREEGYGGAIYSKTGTLTLNSYTPVGSSVATNTAINNCKAPGFSGAVYMETSGSTLNIKDGTVISGCYANQGGAIYLPAGVTMNLTDSPEFTQNGYTTQSGSVVNATEGACIYLKEGSKVNLSGSPKFSRNILPNLTRITNGGILDFVRQDIYLAGYESSSSFDTNAASIYVVGELTGDTIWVWPEKDHHRLPNEQFAKIADGVTVSPDSLSKLRNALADNVTHCSNSEYLAGVQVGTDTVNVYWDKMYTIDFKKIDNKGVAVPDAGFTIYKYQDLNIEKEEDVFIDENVVATKTSADGENDTDSQGTLLARGKVEFSSIRIGAYYMKETKVPLSFEENNTTYLVLVGTPYLAPNDSNRYLWEGDGPLNVTDAATLIQLHTTEAGKFFGIFPLDENNKADLRANLASSNVGIVNTRDDYQAAFMKVDGNGNPLPGAAFTIYTAILDSEDKPVTFDDGYPKLMRWSRDGENYPAPVVSADGTDAHLPKGLVYFRELPLGTYYLLETAYPERNGSGRHTFYLESDRVFKLELKLGESTEQSGEGTEQPEEGTEQAGEIIVTLSEWKPTEDNKTRYEELPKKDDYYVVSNQEVVCKLTDANDNLLYVKGHEVWENKESATRLFPAIYTTLEEGFNAAQTGSFVDIDGNPVTLTAVQTGSFVDIDGNPVTLTAVKLKALKDFTLSEPVTYYNPDRPITFTTAETVKKNDNDRYVFTTTRTSDTSRAQITRAYSEVTSTNANAGALHTITSGASMTLQNINLNGQKNSYNGRAIHVIEGTLTILNNTMLQNFKQEANKDVRGGAILLDNETTLTVDGGTNRSAIFSNNEASTSSNSAEVDSGAIAFGSNCTITLNNAQFIGNSAAAQGAEKGNGGAFCLRNTKEQALTTIHNVVFRNNTASSSGGAVVVLSDAPELTMQNCIFTDNRASDYGGAICILSDARVTFLNAQLTGNSVTSTNEGRGNGGAVYLAGNAQMELENGTIRSNTCTAAGAGIYLAEGSQMSLSGVFDFGIKTDAEGNILIPSVNGSGNYRTADITGNQTNGGKKYTYPVQDIYIAGYSGTDGSVNAASLVVDGEIHCRSNSKSGGYETESIWVWAEEAPHYKSREQFAKIAEDASVTADTLKVFRNAQPDSITGNGTGTYLYGTDYIEVEGIAGNVYWSGVKGSRRVILRKTNQTYKPLKGLQFVIHAGSPDGNPVTGIDIGGNETTTFISGDSGVFYIGELNYGTYYIEEANPKNSFILYVDENGVGKTTDQTDPSAYSNQLTAN